MNALTTKICKKCSVEKCAVDFYRHKAASDGLGCYCKTCNKIISDEWRANNKERTAELHREASARRWEKHRDSLNAKQTIKRHENPQNNRDAVRKWALKNPEKLKEKGLKIVQEMPPYYVASLIGLSVKECPTNLIEMKRESITIKRLSRKIKQTTKAKNETSTDIS